MNFKQLISAGAIAAGVLWAGAANAEVYDFTVTGIYTAHWQLDSTPSPDDVQLGASFKLIGVQGDFPSANGSSVVLEFFNSSVQGGLNIDLAGGTSYLLYSYGPQLYWGREDYPLFKLGTFLLHNGYGYIAEITIAQIPEPETYAMLFAGIGVVALGARRKARRAATA
jgi:hypothetical protein